MIELSYKPTALRLPYIVVFLSLFTLSIGLIEYLLKHSQHRSTEPPVNNTFVARTVESYTVWCDVQAAYSSEFSSLESRYAGICSTFSNVFGRSSTLLPVALQTSFSSWKYSLNDVLLTKYSIASVSNVCQQTTSTAAVTGRFALTAGCTSTTITQWNYECAPRGDIYIDPSGSLETTYTTHPVCAVTQGAQMVLATRTPSTSSSASVPTTSVTTAPKSATFSNVAGISLASTTTASRSSSLLITAHASLTPTTAIFTPSIFYSSHDEPSSTVLGNSSLLVTTPTKSASDTAASPTVTGLVLAAHEVVVTGPFTKTTYFMSLFLAPLIAVVLKVFYEAIVAAIKLVEPFYCISRPAGASAVHSVLARYLRSSMSLDVMRAATSGQLLPLWSLLMCVLVTIVPAIVSASMSVRTTDFCKIDGLEQRCDPVWVVDVPVIRSVEALLVICVFLGIVLILWTWRYNLRMSSNPSSIASIATMLNHKLLLQDLLRIDPDSDEAAFHECLQRYRFWLDTHQDSVTGQQYYGLIGSIDSYSGASNLLSPGRGSYTPVTPSAKQARRKPGRVHSRIRDFLMDSCCFMTVAALLGILVAYFLDYSHSSFNDFFSSNTFFPRFILVGIATLADIQFKNLERVVRVTEPYRRLSLPNAPAQTTILLPLNGTCWSNLPRCVYSLICYSNSHMLWQTVFCIIACLSDLNIVAVAGVLFSDAQTRDSFLICEYVSITITAVMLLAVVALMTWWRNNEVVKRMPRRPETIAAVMSYLCGSKMVIDWINANARIEDMTEQQRNRWIIASGYSLTFEKMPTAVDKKMRWTIDYVQNAELGLRTYNESSDETKQNTSRATVTEI